MPLSSERFFLGALIYNHQIIKKKQTNKNNHNGNSRYINESVKELISYTLIQMPN